MRWAWITVLCFAISGCQTAVEHNTASGKAETTIASATPDKVKASLVNIMINGNFRITKDTPYELAFDGPVTNPAVIILLGSRYDSQPVERISFMMAQIDTSTRVVADLAFITNPGSAFEQRTPVNNGVDSQIAQEVLDQLRTDLDPSSPGAQAKAKGILLGVHTTTLATARAAGASFTATQGMYIGAVDPGSVAERSGILKGDVLVSVGGRAVNAGPELASALNALPAGASSSAVVRRGTQTLTIALQFNKG